MKRRVAAGRERRDERGGEEWRRVDGVNVVSKGYGVLLSPG